MLNNNMHILILGARAPVSLEWARSFAEMGWTVSMADSLHFPLSRFSNACHHYYPLPEPKGNTAKWIDTLVGIVRTHGVDVVLPTCEEVFYLSYGLPQLSPHCTVVTSDFDLLHQLHHKYQFANMTKGWNVAAPETRLVESIEELSLYKSAEKLMVLKPAYSRFASQTLIKPTPRQWEQVHPTRAHPWVIQDFIKGKEHCSLSLLVKGHVTAHACYHPQYRVGMGAGMYLKQTMPQEVLAFVQRFGVETGYTGQVGFDFIESEDGMFYVLECNPRGTSGVHLFGESPDRLCEALLMRPTEPFFPRSGPKMVGLAMIVSAPLLGWDRTFWKDFYKAKDVIGVEGDSMPLWIQPLCLAEICLRALKKRTSLLEAATEDIEWNGQLL